MLQDALEKSNQKIAAYKRQLVEQVSPLPTPDNPNSSIILITISYLGTKLSAVCHQGSSFPARTRSRRGPCRCGWEQPASGPCQAPHLRHHLHRARISGLSGSGIYQNHQRDVIVLNTWGRGTPLRQTPKPFEALTSAGHNGKMHHMIFHFNHFRSVFCSLSVYPFMFHYFVIVFSSIYF